MGLCYVAAAFERAGAEVVILDYIVRKYSPEKLSKELSDFQPDVIGITSVTMNFHRAAAIIKAASEILPGAVTIMGGPHVSFDYEDTLKHHPEIDLIVVGEGEQTIEELLPVIGNRKAWSGIDGIAFRDDGGVVFTGKRELIRDLDDLPFPSRHLLPMSRYLSLGFPISIITSRGCPNRCIFCIGHRMVGNRIRNRNPQKVLDEIEDLLSYGFERINFSDDFFTSNVKRVKEICKGINDRGLSFGWAAFARADSVSEELLILMRDAGCDTVFFGIESGNQQMLDRIKKRVTLDRIRKAVADCKAVGMRVFGSFIVGLPGETMETLMDSHRFAKELDIVYGYHFLAPFPGTEVMTHMDQYDLELLSRDWSTFDANHPIVRTSLVLREDMENFVNNYYMDHSRAVDLDTEKRYLNGDLSDYDLQVFLGKRKMEVVFRLLTEDLIETTEPIPVSNDNIDPGVRLSDAIAPRVQGFDDSILPSVQYLVNQGYLKYDIENNHYSWHWA